MEEQRPIWRVAANILNKQSRTADKAWSTSLGFGCCANNASPKNRIMLRNVHTAGTCESGNEPSGSVKRGEFLD